MAVFSATTPAPYVAHRKSLSSSSSTTPPAPATAASSSTARLRPTLRSLRAVLARATYLHFLLLPALLLLFIETLPSSTSSGTEAPAATPALSAHPNATLRFPQPTPGVSIVACCMNRHDTLRRTLASWLRVHGADEVVLVDWSSDPPLSLPDLLPSPSTDSDSEAPPRIRLVRVDNESTWVLTRAYNLAVQAATRDFVIRTDCDYALHADFLKHHRLEDHTASFYTGNYAEARTENEAHLNGAVVLRRAHFLAVGGYDERIQTYGWDDEDLYSRLQRQLSLSKRNVSGNFIEHVPHDDGARAQRDVTFVKVEIDLNSLLLAQLPAWNRSLSDAGATRYAMLRSDSHGVRGAEVVTVAARDKPAGLKRLVSDQQYEDAWLLALGQRLANDYGVPWDLMVTMDVATRRKMLVNLNACSASAGRQCRLLLAHCMHGLGNRLRALGSAMAYAAATHRVLATVWEKDAHISARLDELVEIPDDMVLLSELKPKWPFRGYAKWDAAWNRVDAYNYMEMEGGKAVKGQIIEDRPDYHLYVKSAYILEVRNASLTNWQRDNERLRSLVPVRLVRDTVAKHEENGLENMVGVHIRDRTLERDIKNVDFDAEYGTSASNQMEYWRRKSSYRNFFTEMHRLVAEHERENGSGGSSAKEKLKFYVATDTIALFDEMEKAFPGRIEYTARDCDGRDGRCVRYALVDLLCLARAKQLIGSNWSSFTEAASRLGGKTPRLSGVDFAKD